MTLPPASANRASILALTSGAAPQPQSSPKVMVPSATSEIRTPVLPKNLYLMRFPRFLGSAATSDQRGPQVLGSAGRPRSAVVNATCSVGVSPGCIAPRNLADTRAAAQPGYCYAPPST